MVQLTSLTELLCLWRADVRWECAYIHFIWESRPASQSGSVWVFGLFIYQLARRRCRAKRMCEHCPVCDLKAAQGFFALAAVILFIPTLGLNELGKHQQIFYPKTQENRLLLFQAPVDKNSGMGDSLHKFQAV